MKMSRTSILSLGAVLICAATAGAVPVTFTLDDTQSSIGLQFASTPYGSFIEQGPGSLETTYRGTVSVQVDNLVAPATIAFTGSSAIADNSGDWLPEVGGGSDSGDPGNPAAGNYGTTLDGGILFGNSYSAIRDLEFDITSGALSITGGSFDSAQDITTAAGTCDYNVPMAVGDNFGTRALSETLPNDAAGNGSYGVAGNLATLRIPVEFTTPDGPSFEFTGVLVGTATIPEPGTLVLAVLACGLAGIAAIRRNRKRGHH